MRRLAGAAWGGVLALALGLGLGALDLRLGPGWGAVGALNGLVLAPLGAGLGALRPPGRPRFTALGLVLALGLALGAAQVGRSLPRASTLARAFLQAQPLPPLREDPGEGPGPVVLLTLDTVRADAVNPRTMPRLHARLEQAVVYTRAWSASTWTLPALASVLTGLPPSGHGAGRRAPGAPTAVRSALDPAAPVLAEELARRGYVSLAVLSNPYLGPEHGLTRGFDRVWQLSLDRALREGLRRARLVRPALPPVPDDAAAVSDRALAALGQAHAGRFFLWVHHAEAHAPYRAEAAPTGGCALPSCFDGWSGVRRGAQPPEPEALRALYAADLARLDTQLERFFAALDGHALGSRALVILLADHGESFGEQGAWEHGSGPWDAQLRVPLAVWAPGQAPGRVDRPVSTAAVYEAALSWADGGGLGPLDPAATAGPVAFAGSLFGPELAGCVVDGVKHVRVGDGIAAYGPGDVPIAADPAPCALELLPEAPGVWTDALSALGYVDP